ncbi:MAG: HD domain-containing phosphohydrolase, partial [Hyphomicrobium sp.]
MLFLSCPLLLLLGGVQIAQLLEWAVTLPSEQSEILVRGIGLIILPLFSFALVSALVATRYVRYSTASVFQTRLLGMRNRQTYNEDLVRLIADNRPGSTMIMDGEKRLWFVNSKAAACINVPAQQVIGLPFEKTFPESEVLRITALLQQQRQTGQAVESIDKVNAEGTTRYIQTHIIPLPDAANMIGAVMVNQDDITSLLVDREARERMFRQVIDTLVAIVDRRDPFAAGHSAHVGQISRALAEQMQLDAGQVETAEIAGLLMNFGKVLVPREILVKTGILSPEELKQVHQGLLTSADILALIGFSQPVVPTLRQALE